VKVMQELVAYFDRKKQLTPRQMRRLLDQGFLASDAPPTMVDLCDAIGATYYFRVQGDMQGRIWGTGTYTGDSPLAVAAVHAGAVKAGETAIVKVTVVRPLKQYQGSIANGVTSNDFGRFGTAYKLARV
jgi:LCCL domain